MMLHQELARLARDMLDDPISGAPQVDFTVSPTTPEDAAAVLGFAAEKGLRTLFWGGGNHQGMGYPVEPDIVISTNRLTEVLDWQVDDLTFTVQPGVRVADLEADLQQRNQTAVLPEVPGSATVGGIVAAGLSGWRRLRYGPTRDRMLEVRLATGDGRLVRGGGRLVKNVTGYDLPRLATGSFGSLGMLTELCLKLWPLPPDRAMLRVADPEQALAAAYRPLALIETSAGATLYLSGTAEEIEAQAALVGGELIPGHRWPEPLAGTTKLSLRVPPSALAGWSGILRQVGVDFQAAHGVGEILFTPGDVPLEEIVAWRGKVESMGGSLVLLEASDGFDFDPWGTPPVSGDLQSRVKEAFDPRRVANPGILPGGI
ncbi:MAG: FAD-binding oxidoreductase [bacterium]|nr:FAD-binding oxidoreductase [bacterium]